MSDTHPAIPGWIVELTLDSAGTVKAFTLRPEHDLPAGGVTARLLRRVPLGELERSMRRRLHAVLTTSEAHVANEPRSQFMHDYLDALVNVIERPGRRGRDDLQYARIAAMYVQILDSGSSRPNAEAAAALHFSPSQFSQLIYRARQRGLLSPSPPGRAGGALTKKAIRLLEVEDGEH